MDATQHLHDSFKLIQCPVCSHMGLLMKSEDLGNNINPNKEPKKSRSTTQIEKPGKCMYSPMMRSADLGGKYVSQKNTEKSYHKNNPD